MAVNNYNTESACKIDPEAEIKRYFSEFVSGGQAPPLVRVEPSAPPLPKGWSVVYRG